MVDLTTELAGISALLHGEYGCVILVILFLGTLFFIGYLMIIVLALVRFFPFICSLLRKVLLRYRNKKVN